MAPKSRASFGLSALPVTLFAHFMFISVTTLVLVWLLHFREGLAFRSSVKARIFNLHPLLMVVGFVLIAGEATMAYKTIPTRRERKKAFHLILHLVALVVGILGIYAVFKFHHEKRIPHLYTLHSWFGLATICLFGLQWVLAFFTFYFPGAEFSRRASFAPWHVVFGMIIFFLAILTAEMGLIEKFVFLDLKQSQEALIVNFIGLLIFLFAVSVGLAVLVP